MKLSISKRVLPAATLLAATFAVPTQAAVVETTLNFTNNNNWDNPGVFATVKIEDGDEIGVDAGDIKFTISLLNQPLDENFKIEQFGFAGTGLDLSTAVFDFTGMTPTWAYDGSANMSVFGTYQDSVKWSGMGSGGDEPLIFTIDITGDTISSYITTPSTGGQPRVPSLFAIKVSSQGPGAFIGESVIPVPAAVWLFGSGLLGLVGIARRKKTV